MPSLNVNGSPVSNVGINSAELKISKSSSALLFLFKSVSMIITGISSPEHHQVDKLKPVKPVPPCPPDDALLSEIVACNSASYNQYD